MTDSDTALARFATLANRPADRLFPALIAMERGQKLHRRLTRAERVVVSLLDARPTHMATLSSGIESRAKVAAQFRLWRMHVNRERGESRPLIYVANIARSADAKKGAGYHVHMLLWDYLHVWTARTHAIALGFGSIDIDQLFPNEQPVMGYAHAVSYVLGQNEPVFGSTQHLRHTGRPKGQRWLLYPQNATLAKHCPQLLSAINRAKDKAVPDEMLAAAVPRFNSAT